MILSAWNTEAVFSIDIEIFLIPMLLSNICETRLCTVLRRFAAVTVR